MISRPQSESRSVRRRVMGDADAKSHLAYLALVLGIAVAVGAVLHVVNSNRLLSNIQASDPFLTTGSTTGQK